MKSKLLLFLCLATWTQAADMDEKPARYHAMLLKKPEATTLLTRFLDSWLETSDQPALFDLLQKRAASGTAADWRVLAALHEFTGNDAAALAALDSAVKLAPEDPATRFAHAKILAKLLSIEPALADLKLAAKDPALHLEATTLTGRLLAQAGRPDEALKAWDVLLAEHPNDLGLHEDLIDLLLQENLSDQALAASRKLTELTKDPYQKAIRRLRTAEILTLASKATEAAAEYAAILELSAQDSWLERETLALTQKLFASGQNPTAWEKFLTAALATAPTRTNLHLALAQFHLASGDTEKALKIHQQLLQTHPGSLPIRQAYIAILQQAGQVKQAADELQLLAVKSPADPALWQQLATIYQTLGDAAKLQQSLDKVIALLPKDANATLQTAQLYEQFQQPEKARKILQSAADAQGPQSDAADAFANFLARHQELDKAIALWTAAAKTADRENLLRISRTLAANGKPAEAHAVLASRIKDFAADPLLLSALCQAALITDQAAATLPNALALLDLAQTPTETQAAVTLAATLVHRAQLEQQTIDQLTAAPNPSTQRLCLLAQLHESLGDSLSAQKTLKQATANDPNHTALYQQIALHETRGDIPAAITTLQELITLPGTRKPNLLKQLVALQRRAGKLMEAVATASEWKTLAPGDKSPFLTLAELQTELGDSQKATAELRRAAAKFGNDAELRDKLIQSLLNAGSHAEALRLQLQLLDEADSLATKLKCVPQIAETARILGRDQEIEDLFRKRIRENPTATAPILTLRELLNAWQRQPEASDLLAQAARLAPADIDLQEQLANQLETANQIDQAEALLLALHQQHPTPESLRKLSSFYLRTGDEEKAATLTQQAALQTTDPRKLESFVLSILQAGNWQAALDVLAAAKPELTSDWRLTYLRGLALEQLGQTDAALKVFIPLLQTQTELANLPKPLTPPNSPYSMRYMVNQYYMTAKKPSPEQQAITEFNQATQMAFVIDSNSGYGYASGRHRGMYSGMPSGPQGNYQFNLPNDARALRLYALVHCLKVYVATPVEKRSPILAQITLPELTFLPGLLKIAALGESDRLDTLLAANPDDYPLALACLNINYFVNFLSTPAVIKPGRNPLLNHRTPNAYTIAYTIKPTTWNLVSEKLLSSHPGAALAAFFQAGRLANLEPEELKKSIATLLAIYRALPADERKSYTYQLLSYASSFKQNPDDATAAAADELLAALTADLDPNDPYALHFATTGLCTKLQTATLAGDYPSAVTLANELVANFQASIKANASVYGNQFNTYSVRAQGYAGYGGYPGYGGYGGSENSNLLPHWQLAPLFSIYNGLLQTAASQGCTFLAPFMARQSGDPYTARQSGNRTTPAVNPTLAELLKELGTTATSANKSTSKSAPTPPAPPTLTITDKPAFLKALEKVSDPLLRLIILDALKFEPEVRTAITTLTDPAANPSVPTLLWSSAYLAARPNELTTAYQLAVRAQAARPDPAISPLAESQLLAIALKMDEKSRATVDLDPVRSLALRRTKSLTDESSRKAFAVHLKTLGLKDAADRLTQPASSIALARRAALSGNSSSSVARPVTAAALIRQGNRPAAARLLYRQMASDLRLPNNYRRSSSEAIQQATQLKLAPDIAETMRPPATASFARRAEFVKILTSIAPPTEVRADIEKLHEEKPNDAEILALYCSVADPAKTAELLKSLAAQPDNDLSDLGGLIMNRESQSRQSIEEAQTNLKCWNAVVTLLNSIPAAQSGRKNLTWINYYANQLATGNSLSGITIPGYGGISIPRFGTPPEKLGNGDSEQEKERIEAITKVAKLRDATLGAVATAMLKHPATASQGFELLSLGRTALGLDDATLYQHALDSLGATLSVDLAAEPNAEMNSSYSPQQARWSMFQQGSITNSGQSISGGIQPEEFLASYATTHPDLDISATLLAKLPEAAAAPLKSWFAFFAKPTAPEAATRLKQTQSEPNQLRIFLTVSSLANCTCKDTSTAFDLLFAAIEPKSLVQPDSNDIQIRNSPATRAIVTRWLNTQDFTQRWSRLHQLATSILGPERLWSAYSSINFQNGDAASRLAYSRLGIFNSFATPQDNDPLHRNHLHDRFIRAYGLPNLNPNEMREFYSLLTSSENADPAVCQQNINQLLATNLFLPGPGLMNDDGTFLGLNLSRHGDEKINKLVGEALLKITGPNRFWANFTGLLITHQNADAILPLLEAELPAIKKWPSSEQMAFASFLTTTWPDLEKSSAASWLTTNTRGATQLLTTRLKESIQICRDGRNYNIRNQIQSQTLALLRRDPDSIIAIWNEALTQEANNPPTQGTGYGYSGGSSPCTFVEEIYAQLISNLSNSSEISPITALRCVLSLTRTPAHRALAVRKPDLNSRFDYNIYQILQNRPQTLPAKWQSLKEIPAARLIPLFEILTDQDLVDFPQLMRRLGDSEGYIGSIDAKTLESLESWLKEDIEPKKPFCAKYARFILTYNLARRGSSNDGSRPMTDAACALLAEPAISASRLGVLYRIVSSQSIALSNPDFLTHVMAWAKDPTPPSTDDLQSSTSFINVLARTKSLPPELAAQLVNTTIPSILKATAADPNYSSNQASILASWLTLAHQSHDKKAIESAVAANLPSLAGRYDQITQLTLDGYPEVAATLVPKPHEISLLDSGYLYAGGNSGSKNFRFTKTLEAGLPKLLAAIPVPQQRYRVECLMNLYPEATNDAEKPMVPRADRIAKLIARYATDAPPHPQAKLEILCAIAPGPNDELTNELRPLCGNLLMGDIIEQKYNSRRSNANPADLQHLDYQMAAIERLISTDLDAGNPASFFRQAQSMLQVDERTKYYTRENFHSLFQKNAPRSLTCILQAPADKRAGLLKQATDLTAGNFTLFGDNMNSYSIAPWRLYLILAHAAAGQGPALEPWWQAQSDAFKKIIPLRIEANQKSNTYQYLSSFPIEKGKHFAIKNHPQAAQELFTSLLADPSLSNTVISSSSDFSNIVSSNLLDFETVQAAIDAVPDTVARKPEYLAGKAAILSRKLNQPDAAEKTYLQAKELAKQTNHTDSLDMINANHASMLVNRNRDTDARAVATLVNPEKLDTSTRKLFEDSLKKLEKREAAALKANPPPPQPQPQPQPEDAPR